MILIFVDKFLFLSTLNMRIHKWTKKYNKYKPMLFKAN